MKDRNQKNPDDLVESKKPWLGIHTLSEFAFCSRAGICSFDNSGNDDGEELFDRPGFYHLPIFFKNELELQQEELHLSLYTAMGVGLAFVITSTIAGFMLHSIFYFTAMLSGTISLFALMTIRARIKEISTLLLKWKDGKSVIPGMELTEPTAVYWPNFFVAEYECDPPQDVMEDGDWRLCGKPWRILHRGKLVIPVFLRNVTDMRRDTSDDPKNPRLRNQHFVRIAAYCHLLELSRGLHVPFGVILTRGELTGMAVPNSQETRERLGFMLEEARGTMQDLANKPHEYPMKEESKCFGCPHGRPIPHQEKFISRNTGERDKRSELDAHTSSTRLKEGNRQQSPRRYHSHCGDRFRWLPPHQLTISMELEED
jgi:hypothetical protein